MAVRPEDFGAVEIGSDAITPEQFGAQEERGILQRVSDLFTGADRETQATKTLPEGVQIPFEMSGRQAKAALGLMTTFDPIEQMSVLRNSYPDLTFSQDEKGNIIVDASAYGGGKGLLNAPGVSLDDITRLGFQVLSFTPAGRLGAGAGLVGGAARVAAGSAATQVGIDVLGQSLGATGEGEQEGVQISDINPVDVALAAIGGAGGELIGRGIARLIPALRRAEVMPVDKSIKAAARSALDDIARHETQFGPTSREFQMSVFRQQGISDDIANMILDEVPPIKAAEAAAREADQISREFRIPYSSGQRTGSPAQLQAEEAFRMGGGSKEAQQVARTFEQTQQAAIEEAVRRGATQAGSAPVIGSAIDAAETATSAVKSAAQQMDEAVKAAYDQVPKGTFMYPDAALNVSRGIRRAVRGMEFDTSLPGTSKALNDLDLFEKHLSVMSRLGKGKAPKIPFNRIEQYRRKLNGYMKGADVSPTDRRQVLLMKQALDEYTDKAVADGLLFGTDDAADAIGKVENARALRRLYAETFEPQPSRTRAGVGDADPAGRLINKMAELEPDAGEISNALFGSGSILGKKESAELVKRVGTAIGKESPEFQQIKQAAFLKIFGVDKGQLVDAAREGPVRISGTQALKSLQEVLGGRSKAVARELFTKEEIDGMVRLARAIKRAQPEPFNPSGTAGQINAQFRDQAGKLMNMLGFTAGPVEGAILSVAQKGIGEISEANATAIARQVFSGRPLQVIGQKIPGGAVAAPSIQAGMQATQQQGQRPK